MSSPEKPPRARQAEEERRALQPDDDPVSGPTRANLLHEEQAAEDARLEDHGESIGDDLQGHRGVGIPAADDVRSDNIDEQTQQRR